MHSIFSKKLAALALILAAFSAHAQEKTTAKDPAGGPSFTSRKVQSGAGGIFNLPEVGAVIMSKGSEIKVEVAIPVDHRLKAYRDIDLQTGDLILMMNAKRLKSAQEMEEIYNSLKVGEEVKLGIKRNEARFIVSFAKADPKDLPQRTMMVMATDDTPEGGQAVPKRRIVMGGQEFSGDVAVLAGLGIIAGSKDGGEVRVLERMPGAGRAQAEIEIKKDDVVLSLNGEKIKSATQLGELYEKIATGARVELQYRRGDKTMTAALAKPQEPAGLIRREVRE